MTREEAISHLEDIKDEYEYFPDDKEALIMAIEALKQPEILTYAEQCIFLVAMGREKKLCEKLDKNIDLSSKYSLTFICREIERKVKATLWRENNEDQKE